jgi:hypothetical protein
MTILCKEQWGQIWSTAIQCLCAFLPTRVWSFFLVCMWYI